MKVCRDGREWIVYEPPVVRGWFWHEWEGGWEQTTLDVVDHFATEGSTVVDIGGWIGPVSMWAASIAARVIAVEPDPIALKYLRVNCRRNAPNVEIIPGAVAEFTGITHLEADATGWASSMSRLSSQGVDVPCWTLPDLFDILDIENCSLIKMDIEGAECRILEHAAPFLAQQHIPLWVSMHEEWWTQPVESKWFDGFSRIEGSFSGFDTVLAVP